MTEYAIVKAEPIHAVRLARNLNPADRDEILAASGADPYVAIVQGMRVSGDTWAGLADGKLVCMFGCVPPQSLFQYAATPWLLGTPLIKQHARRFLRESRLYFDEMKRQHKLLVNYVDVRHTDAQRWLAWLGFTLDPPKPHGVSQLPFRRFEARSECALLS